MEPLKLDPPDTGVLFVVSGPSGVGKSTLLRDALDAVPGIEFSVSATTRKPREGERDGVDYHFISKEAFAEAVEQEAFLEHATVYGRHYGTLAAPTREAMAAGRTILLDVDVQGARQIRRSQPDAVHIFILPPDLPTIERRLRARKTDREEIIQLRLREMDEQIEGAPEYDYVVVNDDLRSAQAVFRGILLAEMWRRERRASVVRRTVEAAQLHAAR